jgi:o-succinylbenzoate---CoA ligase
MIFIDFNHNNLSLSSQSGDEHLTHAIDFFTRWKNGETSFTFKSSGSTGEPKEITLSKDFLIRSAQRTIDLFQIAPSDTLLLALNTSFMGGLMMIVRALVARCQLICINPQDLNTASVNALPPIKLASLVPLQVQKLLSEGQLFQSIEYLLIGGATISKALQDELYDLNTPCTFYHTYGMTETASHVALKNISKQETQYTALQGYTFSTDERSCLTIHHIAEPTFSLQTNDVVTLHNHHCFEWIGRADWIINSGGIKFSIEKSEEVIAAFFSNQQEAFLFTSHKASDERFGERWILIIQSQALTQEQEHALVHYCKTHLGEYIYPKEIRYTKKIVYLPSGKVDRLNTYQETL